MFLKMEQDSKWKLLGILFLAVLIAILMFLFESSAPLGLLAIS